MRKGIGFKNDVDLPGVQVEILEALIKIKKGFFDPNGYLLTVTSVCDGKHREGSRHYDGQAMDLRSYNLPKSIDRSKMAGEIQEVLGKEYLAIYEANPPHFHIEYRRQENE